MNHLHFSFDKNIILNVMGLMKTVLFIFYNCTFCIQFCEDLLLLAHDVPQFNSFSQDLNGLDMSLFI